MSEDRTFFSEKQVKKGKNQLLKMRLQTIIHDRKMSESDFYNKLGISKQYWYCISWGIWDAPLDLKIKIAKELNTDSALIWQEEKNGN